MMGKSMPAVNVAAGTTDLRRSARAGSVATDQSFSSRLLVPSSPLDACTRPADGRFGAVFLRESCYGRRSAIPPDSMLWGSELGPSPSGSSSLAAVGFRWWP